jgi:DNA-binding CsgD family transcriptional regulator
MSIVSENPVRLGQREEQIVELLLQGCDNDEIARQLKMARRTVKAHFNRLFLRFGIRGGIKRVKLATLMYRRQLEGSDLSSLPEITAAETSMHRANSSHSVRPAGGEFTSPSVERHEDLDQPQKPELLETWEHDLLGLGDSDPHEHPAHTELAHKKEEEKQLA